MAGRNSQSGRAFSGIAICFSFLFSSVLCFRLWALFYLIFCVHCTETEFERNLVWFSAIVVLGLWIAKFYLMPIGNIYIKYKALCKIRPKRAKHFHLRQTGKKIKKKECKGAARGSRSPHSQSNLQQNRPETKTSSPTRLTLDPPLKIVGL